MTEILEYPPTINLFTAPDEICQIGNEKAVLADVDWIEKISYQLFVAAKNCPGKVCLKK